MAVVVLPQPPFWLMMAMVRRRVVLGQGEGQAGSAPPGCTNRAGAAAAVPTLSEPGRAILE
jgi:hypothetical protein